jgi:DNA-binding response OmpR family regulator
VTDDEPGGTVLVDSNRFGMERVLIVDDEPGIVDVLAAYLRDENFDVHVAFDGEQALLLHAELRPDIVLLDLKLPKKSGIDVYREIRRGADTAVIMITSRIDEIDRIVGLELGADDYIAKPFSPREVVARVKSVLRRVKRVSGPQAVRPQRFGDIELDREGHEVRRAGSALKLTPMEFRIFDTLASHPGRTFTRAQLLDAVSSDDLDVYDRTLDRHIANLRHKVEADAAHPRHIVTVFGIGYKLVES